MKKKKIYLSPINFLTNNFYINIFFKISTLKYMDCNMEWDIIL